MQRSHSILKDIGLTDMITVKLLHQEKAVCDFNKRNAQLQEKAGVAIVYTPL
jgi:hypothetical protein